MQLSTTDHVPCRGGREEAREGGRDKRIILQFKHKTLASFHKIMGSKNLHASRTFQEYHKNQNSVKLQCNWLYGTCRYNKKHLDARIGAILITIHPDIIKCRACLITSIIRPGHTRVYFVTVIKTVQLRGGLALSKEGAWGALSWRRGHLWLNSLCVWLYSQGKVEQEGGIGTCGQRIVYHCGESYRWYGRGVHVIEFVARVGVNRYVQGEPVVFNI